MAAMRASPSRRSRPIAGVALLVTATLAAAPAAAQIPSDRSGTETIFGTGNVDGVTGNRSMAAGISPEGELSLLKWPSPSFFDQVSYLTPPLTLEDTTALRDAPYNGAAPTDGVFFGLVVEDADGGRTLTWTRDPPWTHAHRYADASSALVVTEATHAALSLRALPRGV